MAFTCIHCNKEPGTHKAHFVGMDDNDFEPLCCKCWDDASYDSAHDDHTDCITIEQAKYEESNRDLCYCGRPGEYCKCP
jgi:hypothetical protein